MSDVFLSYSHHDLTKAETLAQLLEANSVAVWWDRRLFPGDKFHSLIDAEIEKAKAVIVLWSPASVCSDWVLGEAQTARDLGKLVPIKIADCKLPLPYRALHTPEIYKSEAELRSLASLISEKFRQPQTGIESSDQHAEVEFSTASSENFLQRLWRQKKEYDAELAEIRKQIVWYNPLTWWTSQKKIAELQTKYYPKWWGKVLGVFFVLMGCFFSASFISDNLKDPADAVFGALVGMSFIGFGVLSYRSASKKH